MSSALCHQSWHRLAPCCHQLELQTGAAPRKSSFETSIAIPRVGEIGSARCLRDLANGRQARCRAPKAMPSHSDMPDLRHTAVQNVGLHKEIVSSESPKRINAADQHQYVASSSESQQPKADVSALPALTRRTAGLLGLAIPLLLSGSGTALAEETPATTDSELVLVPYEDKKEGFSVSRPQGWEIVEKAGATLLIEDPRNRKNSIGVVVNPVRIDSLTEFGDAETVGENVLVAERKKGSTNSATMLRIDRKTARTAGAPLYTLEYALDSSRGGKRTLTAVTVVRKKLFILNITYPDSPEKPAPLPLADALHQVLDSFDVSK
ncbi:psbP family protein [Klebsormidium nitens]|uniref:PsbP family protein n=1 Tax=Klebsormidium nitens TaxID=105231 RepID=A0A1Y1I5X6_KLENI|nr:psbP family protein [Klebsormidium nitens]|eukprot:GAQ85893.1 psbP family protein [Klebsormidium nitens]